MFLQATQISDFDQTAAMMRARKFDACARQFLTRYPDGMVVDIGCGLDTRFDRLDNGTLIWYGIDLLDVIRLRRLLLPDTDRSHAVASSALDPVWLDQIEAEHRPVIFLAEGLFPYFTEPEVKSLVLTLMGCFPGAELVFDAISGFAIRLHQLPGRTLKGAAALVHWGLDDPRELEHWGPGIHLLEAYFYYQDQEPRMGLFNLTRFIPVFGRASKILHYRLTTTQ